MLTINLKLGQRVRIGDDISITCIRDGRRENRLSVKIEAPRDITITRPAEAEAEESDVPLGQTMR